MQINIADTGEVDATSQHTGRTNQLVPPILLLTQNRCPFVLAQAHHCLSRTSYIYRAPTVLLTRPRETAS